MDFKSEADSTCSRLPGECEQGSLLANGERRLESKPPQYVINPALDKVEYCGALVRSDQTEWEVKQEDG